MDINTCFETTNYYHLIAYYSHLLPAALAIFLSSYTLFKTQLSKLSVLFFAFTVGFSLWLIGDLIIWVHSDYNLVYFMWSWLDHVNVVFYALGAYFFSVLARGSISRIEKTILLIACLPTLLITATGNSVTDFYLPWCEASENSTITNYKLFAEWVFIMMMFVSMFIAWKPSAWSKRIRLIVMLLAILLFFATFSVTEYLAVQSGIYEIHLYSLFVLPLFLIIVTFSITNLGIFNIRYLGTQLLVYVLILMVGSQFLFLQDSTDLTLNVITLVISIFLGLVLLQNSKNELKQKELAQRLATELAGANMRLEKLDKMKSEFVSIASHQLRSPLTSIRGYVSMVLEGSYGEVNEKAKGVLQHVADSARHMALSVEDYLNVSRIEAGNMKYDIADHDLRDIVEDIVADMQPVASERGIPLVFKSSFEGTASVKLDVGKSRQIIQNLIDNAFKYTQGKEAIEVSIRKDEKAKRVFVDVKDHGIGLSKESIESLFEKFERAKNASTVNVTGTGLGLYIARTMARAMEGDITVASEGEGKGSVFTISFPLNGIEGQWTTGK